MAAINFLDQVMAIVRRHDTVHERMLANGRFFRQQERRPVSHKRQHHLQPAIGTA